MKNRNRAMEAVWLLVLVLLFCSSCGNSDNNAAVEENTMESAMETPEAETAEQEKGLEEIKEDLNANCAKFLDSFGEGYQVEDLELIKRNTKGDSDEVYCTVSLVCGEAFLKQDFKFTYNHYTTGGWILDEFEPTGDIVAESTNSSDADIEGNYIGEDDGNGLAISSNPDGSYLAKLEVFRLTSIEDFVGNYEDGILKVTGTDASGNPIKAEISFADEQATLVFTDSTWMYLENGERFVFEKQSTTGGNSGFSMEAGGGLTENQTFYYYDGETEVTVELYPDNGSEGRIIFSMKEYDEGGDVTEEESINGYYCSISSSEYAVLEDNGEETGITFTVNLDSYPSTLTIVVGGNALELTDLEWVNQNAG